MSKPSSQSPRERAKERAAGPAKASDLAITITADGKKYPLSVGDVTSLDVVALRRATGMGVRALVGAAATDPDIDVIAAIVWLSRRSQGERALRFEEVAADLSYDTSYQIDFHGQAAAADDEDAPEA